MVNPSPLAQTPLVSISIVSHNQAQLVHNLLSDIDRYCGPEIEVILTMNIQEEHPIDAGKYLHNIKIITNITPKGFGANHNAALGMASGKYYCVMNPDIRFVNNPIAELLTCITDKTVGIAAPLITDSAGVIEDSARRFPTPFQIFEKALTGKKSPEYKAECDVYTPDWVGGMFMLIPAEIFHKIGGFDERYFLYYEDVDLCARMRLAGYDIRLCTKAKVIHDARRQSHHDLKYFRWHLASMLRFFFSMPFIRIQWRRLMGNNP